jgi:NAD(P) transhydrogenase
MAGGMLRRRCLLDDEPESYDLIVIGGGPAGEKGAAQAAYFGKRVAIIEADELGGSATNTGTLPSKTLRETALHVFDLRQRDPHGLRHWFNRALSPEELFYRKRLVVESYQQLVHENIERHGIGLFRGAASLVDGHTVRVARADGDTAVVKGRYVLIASGSSPFRPPDAPFDGEHVYDSDTILKLKRLPSSLIVVGAGVIGCEYASLFAALGISVSLIERGERLLSFLDREIVDALVQRFRELGIDLMLGQSSYVIEVSPEHDCARVRMANGSELSADAVLYCGGRQGNTQNLGLEGLGIKTDARGRIEVNERYQTAVPNVYAAGDVIGFPALASTSMEQARVAICHAFSFDYKKEVSTLVPYGIYTIPEVAMVGATEESLRESRQDYLVGQARYGSNPRAQIAGDTSGFVKLLFDPDSERIVGVHIIGEQASELIHIGQACMYYGGTLDFFIRNVFNFPTLADMYKYAAYDGLGNLQRYRESRAQAVGPSPPSPPPKRQPERLA